MSASPDTSSSRVFANARGPRRRARNRRRAQQVATNAGWIYETSQQALRRIDEAVADDISTISGEDIEDIGSSVASLPGRVRIYVVDANGDMRYSSSPNIQPINITDREYFQAAAGGQEMHVSGLLIKPYRWPAGLHHQPAAGARRCLCGRSRVISIDVGAAQRVLDRARTRRRSPRSA
ncbi:MAG: hypothetical protein WDN31_05355 [Hyphomicrobium sp.]